MSYILEALRKSEQERRRGEMPEINRFENLASEDDRKFKLWPVVAVVLVVANLLVLFLWAPWSSDVANNSFSDSQPPVTPQSQPQSADNVSSSISIKPVPKTEVIAERKPVKNLPDDVEIIRPRTDPIPPMDAHAATNEASVQHREPDPEPSVERTPNTSYLPQLQELSSDLQSQIPDMSFSSHMYSSEPRFRSITINGKRLKEGHYLNDQIQVREITDKGVILGLDNTIFEVDVLGQWVN
ncbi:MAG: general secretion pathway protein GspB [Pseudomonadales bacterium]|nr:general secretion pathway protein GspB [Pseudomonadales bacterium]